MPRNKVIPIAQNPIVKNDRSYYRRLRALLVEQNKTCEDLARCIGISARALSNKMQNHTSWTAWEMYTAMDYLSQPYSELYKVFPPKGMYIEC